MYRRSLKHANAVTMVHRWTTSNIVLPKRICVLKNEDRQKVLGCIQTAMDSLLLPTRRVNFDFSKVRVMNPAGMLFLLSYIEQLLATYQRRIRARCPTGSLAAQLLHMFDVGKNLGVSASGNLPRHKSVTNWRYRTGETADGRQIQSLLEQLEQEYGGVFPDGLYDAISEALTNVRHHAYPVKDSRHLVGLSENLKRWWIFATVGKEGSPDGASLTLAVYDMGVGIIDSLRKGFSTTEKLQDFTNGLMKKFSIPSRAMFNAYMLKEAVEHGKSSTLLPYRGKGLPEMLEFTTQTRDGQMTILTSDVHYSYSAGSDSLVFRCESALRGTLLSWYLPLPSRVGGLKT